MSDQRPRADVLRALVDEAMHDTARRSFRIAANMLRTLADDLEAGKLPAITAPAALRCAARVIEKNSIETFGEEPPLQ